MVRQLLTVSRLDSGVLRPVAEVFALGPRVRRAWEALGAGAGAGAASGTITGAGAGRGAAPGAGPAADPRAGAVPFDLVDEAGGWLAVADPDHVDQVIWALLDNAVKYGRGTPASAHLAVDPAAGQVRLTIADGGPGVAPADRERLFTRYARGASDNRDGTGLGLYVSRELARANGGDLVLEPGRAGEGAALALTLPAEAPTEG
jgi:signal transduction histidine kinase